LGLARALALAERGVGKCTDAHQDTPENDEADDRSARAGTNERLSEGGNDDENQLEPVHLLAANNVGEGAKADLADDGAGRGGQLDGRVLRRGQGALVVVLVDDAQHDGQQRDAKDVVAVGEEAGAGNQNGPDVVPSKGSFVDFGESQTTTLVGILNVGKVIVEVVERVVPAGGSCSHLGEEALPMLGCRA
jgi:hypothetical protein